MAHIQFPFWIVMRRQGLLPVPAFRKAEPGCAIAFTAAVRAAGYVGKSGQTGWQFKMASRATFPALVAELRRLGVTSICFDPDERGEGQSILLDDVSAAEAPVSREG